MYLYQPFTFKTLLVVVMAAVMLHCGQKQQSSAKARPEPKVEDSIIQVQLAFAGDVMNHKPQIDAAHIDSTDGYDFSPVFQYVTPVISQADIAVANLETTFGGKPYTGYPQFSAPDTLAFFLKNAGFDMMVTANNHAADRGGDGIAGTINGLDKAGLPHTGTFLDSAERAARYPLIIEKKGLRIAFLNYTYGTNGLPVPAPRIVNIIDTAIIAADMAKAKDQKADAVVVVYHWGIEYQRQPNAEQKAIARFTLAHGADLVIGSHPHVIQPAVWETYTVDSTDKKGLVLYSLGNFVSNQRDRYKDAGMVFFVNLKFNKHSRKLSVESPAFVPTWVYIQPQPRTYFILPSAAFVSDSTFIKAGKENMLQSLEDTRQHMTEDSMGVVEKAVNFGN